MALCSAHKVDFANFFFLKTGPLSHLAMQTLKGYRKEYSKIRLCSNSLEDLHIIG
jgi:hypothetical protein